MQNPKVKCSFFISCPVGEEEEGEKKKPLKVHFLLVEADKIELKIVPTRSDHLLKVSS